jgi:hypothetical protein
MAQALLDGGSSTLEGGRHRGLLIGMQQADRTTTERRTGGR